MISEIKKSIKESKAIKSVNVAISDDDTNSELVSSMSGNKALTSKTNDSLNEKFNSTITNNTINLPEENKDMMANFFDTSFDNAEPTLIGAHYELEES